MIIKMSVKNLWLASDIHLNGYNWSNVLLDLNAEGQSSKSEDGLILAGDILEANRLENFSEFFKRLSSHYKYVWLLLGNHDYWGSSLGSAKALYEDFVSYLPNTFIINKDSIYEVNGVFMIGDTLWTDFNELNPRATTLWKNTMNDAVYINKKDYRSTINCIDIYSEHQSQREAICNFITANKSSPIIVVTHHAPSSINSDEYYLNHYTMDYYASDLSDFILDNRHIKFWCHGHMHTRKSNVLGDTTIVCNAYGYTGQYFSDKFALYKLLGESV